MIYTIKSTMISGANMPEEEVTRTIRIGGSDSLDDLCRFLLQSLDFDHDHMYAFHMDNKPYSNNGYISGGDRRGMRSTREKLYKLGLKRGQKFLFIYDFGDDWMFQMEVLSASGESGNIRAQILESTGMVEQYPEWDEMEEDGDAIAFGDEDGMTPGEEDTALPGREGGSGSAGISLTGAAALAGISDMDGEMDFTEEFFDSEDDEYDRNETNPRLGRVLLRVVEKQIEDKKPAFVRKAYVALQEKGYIRKLAKVKLATALINEIFEIMKYNKPYSEERYRTFIDEVLVEKFDEDSVINIETGREHTLTGLLNTFEEQLLEEENPDAAARTFLQLWPMLRSHVDNNYTRETETGLKRCSLDFIEEMTDYRMNLFNTVLDADMAFLNSGRYEDGAKILKEIMDTFDWKPGENASIRGSVGECLERAGRTEEADHWFRDWFRESDKDPDCANYYATILMERGEAEAAEQLLADCLPGGLPADEKYINLYSRMEELCQAKGDKKGEKTYRTLIDKIEASNYSDKSFPWFSNKPVVKMEAKVYPNDPCPCGSGKKYKKCCGKNK